MSLALNASRLIHNRSDKATFTVYPFNMVTILKIYCAIVMKRRKDQTRWHVQRNCWECLGLMEAEECATCRPWTRLGYSSMASTAGCPIRCRQTDRWCLVRDFKAESDFCCPVPPPPPPPTHVVLSPSTFA